MAQASEATALALNSLRTLMQRAERIRSQRPKDKNKLYALHAPEVECISKGKARTPYEFGVKVSIATTLKEGLVVGMRCMPAGLGYKPIQQGGWCRVSVWPTHIDRRRRS